MLFFDWVRVWQLRFPGPIFPPFALFAQVISPLLETFTESFLSFEHGMEENEVSRWLGSISSGLDLQQFANDFEARGFTTLDSLKYVEASDLDVFFPSPRKLSYAQKKILLKEIERLPKKDTTTQAENSSTTYIETPVGNITPTSQQLNISRKPMPPTGFFDRKEEGLTGDMEFLQTRIISAKNELTRLQHKANEYEEKAPKRGKSCSNCHRPRAHKRRLQKPALHRD